jgi:phosphoenolpyruvate-protein kinase (PTS system EI component)
MIETPAALYQIGRILEQADFVSIGTNDLAQFILAADRYAVSMLDECSVLHPAVLSAVRDIVRECEKSGCPVSVCGESAGDPKTACFLVTLGIRNFSMSPESSPRVRQAVRRLEADKWKQEAEHALDSGDIEKIRKKADEISEDVSGTETPVGKEED